MAKARVRVFARRPFDYGALELDRGQVFELAGAANDEKLTRLGYCAEVDKGAEMSECSECHAEFIGLAEKVGHGQKRHPEVPFTPDQIDRMEEREEKRLDVVAPLYLENTAASRR